MNMKKLLYIAFLLSIMLACGPRERKVGIGSKEFEKVIKILQSGNWDCGDRDCNESYQSFKFDVANKIVTLSAIGISGVDEKPLKDYEYEILWALDVGFRGRIIGEDRLDDSERPVEWDLLLVDENAFIGGVTIGRVTREPLKTSSVNDA